MLLAPLTRGQYLAHVSVRAGALEELNALSDERLRGCVGAVAAAQLTPKCAGERDARL